MECEIEYTDEFGEWWDLLNSGERSKVHAEVEYLRLKGTKLRSPKTSQLKGTTRYNHLRELRIQHKGDPYRIIYAFDPRRMAILLLGGNKRGDKRWYDVHIPIAETLYDVYLHELREEGLLDG